MNTSVKLHSLGYTNIKTYLFAFLFVLGNLILPQVCHLLPVGGPVLLPIYFFTLIAAYKYGLHVGILTALFSPVANSLIFGMPSTTVLPIILIKSGLLAVIAAYIAKYYKEVSWKALLCIVLAYQIIGTAIEWAIVKDFFLAVQDFRMGVPGMLLQIIGGYFVLKSLAKY